jgi:hypothetical protein
MWRGGGTTSAKVGDSPHERDIIFGVLGCAFYPQWASNGYAHITNCDCLPKVIKWARLATHANCNSTAIITMTYDNWYIAAQLILDRKYYAY